MLTAGCGASLAHACRSARRRAMKPRGPLMIEHRLIEKMLAAAKEKAESIAASGYDPVTIETIVDFVKTYADRTHHGKEEDILFAELRKKRLDSRDAAHMAELIDEHRQARARVKRIVELNDAYKKGDRGVVSEIVELVLWLAAFYPVHIRKEDKVFFPDTERYFSPAELERMLGRFWEFDRTMIHEKYRRVYETFGA
jgi:hemerythrin-like domain-containing protein